MNDPRLIESVTLAHVTGGLLPWTSKSWSNGWTRWRADLATVRPTANAKA